MAKKKSSLMFTYIGVIRKADDVETIILDEIMRKFQSGKRYLRERIFEGKSRKEAVDMAKPLFINNSRYMRDAFLEAEASISSQKELLPTYIQQNQLKVAALNEQITKLTNSKKKNKEGKIKYKHSKLKKLTKQNNYYQYDLDKGTVPKIVDGSKQLFKELVHIKITKEEWRDARSNAVYSRGEKSKGGNENIKLSYLGENLFEMLVLNPFSDKRGDRLSFVVCFPDKFVFSMASYLETGESYSVRILRRKDKYEVHFAMEEENSCEPTFEKRNRWIRYES